MAAIACLSDLDDIFYPPLESPVLAEMLRSAGQLRSTKSIPAIPLLEYQWSEGEFDTLWELGSAHRSGGTHPSEGGVLAAG